MWRRLPYLLFLVLAFSSLLLADYRRFKEESLPHEIDPLMIEQGSGFGAITRKMLEQGVPGNPLYWRLLGMQKGVANKLHAGEYMLTAGMTANDILEHLVSGKVKQHPFKILEGWTVRDLIEELSAESGLQGEIPHYEDLARLYGMEDNNHPEGLFFPDTYYFVLGDTRQSILERANRRLLRILEKAWKNKLPNLQLNTPYQALILASIIEKETALPEEMTVISGVFHRRLMKNMRLQTDPTVIYGIGETFDGDIRRKDLRTDTPYNTYTRHGLPPTPIALAGEAAIMAAVQPAPGSSLYFVADGQGRHIFSDTLEQHQQAVRKYQLSQ